MTCCTDAGKAPPAQTRREAIFVALTLAGIVLGLVATWAAWPAYLGWIGYGVAYGFGGWYGARGGLEALRERRVDIDLLMVLAALGALAIGQPFEGALLLFLFSLSNVLQHVAIGRSRRALEALVKLRPDEAAVLRDGREVLMPLAEVRVGDVFALRPGGRVPLDGRVVRGASTMDEASLTGESAAVGKEIGSEVFAGTINGSGTLDVEVTRPLGASSLDRLIALVEEAQGEKATAQRLIDRLEQPYALGVLGLTAVALAIPLALGATFAPSFYRAMTLLVAASPCALVISTPAVVLSAIAAGARRGVLFKGGVTVEEAARINVLCFDKTGTLTEGKTRLVAATPHPASGLAEGDLLALAAAVQARSEHHLAGATVQAATAQGIVIPEATDFQATVGRGVRARVDGDTVHIGNRRYFSDLPLDVATERALQHLQEDGQTAVLVVRECEGARTVLGWMGFADTVRPGAAETIQKLRDAGIAHIVILTGDNAAVARAVGRETGIDEIHAELLPEQKVEKVRALAARYGAVAMVGDGVNDAPALAAATIGVAMGGAGTDVALETADVVLMADDLGQLPYAFALSRAARRTLRVNLGFALGVIVLMVATILTNGLALPLAVVGHEGSTVLVSLNGLRLLGYR